MIGASIAIGIPLGLAGGVLLAWWSSRRALADVRRKAQGLRARTQAEVQRSTGAARALAEGERVAIKAVLEEELQQLADSYAEAEADLEQRAVTQAEQERVLGEQEAALDAHQAILDERATRLAEQLLEVDIRNDQLGAAIARRAETTPAEALSTLRQDRLERARHEAQQRLRAAEERAADTAGVRARHVFDVAIDRFTGVDEPDRWSNTIPIDDPEQLKLLCDEQGPLYQTLCRLLGTEIFLDSETASAHVKADDPLARELSRRVLKEVAQRGLRAPDTLERLVADARAALERDVRATGQRAVNYLKLKGVSPQLVETLGRLKYRLSYSQNQWHHALEAAVLASLMAAELRQDIGLAKRATLLHDIGKALTHEQEGSHAVLGAHLLREHGESPELINAVASHHGDVQAQSIVATLVAVADALSGGRPGARRETVTTYLRRIEELEGVISGFPAVSRIDVMHAGREVRVFVGEDDRFSEQGDGHAPQALPTDAEIQPLAKDIAGAIERELEFPGQIRVTVIKESRVVAYAR